MVEVPLVGQGARWHARFMPSAYGLLVVLHAIFGLTSLAVVPIPLVAGKGGAIHRRVGRWFVWTMAGVSMTGLGIALTWLLAPHLSHPELTQLSPEKALAARWKLAAFATFFLSLAGLTGNAVVVGVSSLWRDHPRAVRFERSFGLPLGLVSGVLVGVGVAQQNPLFVVFGLLGVANAWGSLRTRPGVREGRERIVRHAQAMLGGTTAALTAFSALTLRRWIPGAGGFEVAFWLVPVALGVGLSVGWTHRLRYPRS